MLMRAPNDVQIGRPVQEYDDYTPELEKATKIHYSTPTGDFTIEMAPADFLDLYRLMGKFQEFARLAGYANVTIAPADPMQPWAHDQWEWTNRAKN